MRVVKILISSLIGTVIVTIISGCSSRSSSSLAISNSSGNGSTLNLTSGKVTGGGNGNSNGGGDPGSGSGSGSNPVVTPPSLPPLLSATGTWERSDQQTFVLAQSGNSITGSTPGNQFFSHSFSLSSGLNNPNFFSGKITRTNLSNGCVTLMDAKLTLISPYAFSMTVTGSDGKCDLSTSYHESFVYNLVSDTRASANILATGNWKRGVDDVVFTLNQSGGKITGDTYTNARFSNAISVDAVSTDAALYLGKIQRTNRQNGCVTVMKTALQMLSLNSMMITVSGTDGKCDLPISYSERFVYVSLAHPDLALSATGMWQRPDSTLFTLSQVAGNVTGTITNNSVFAHSATFAVETSTNLYHGSIVRTQLSNGCTTVMTGYVEMVTAGTAVIGVSGTDGKCDLSPAYREEFFYSGNYF